MIMMNYNPIRLKNFINWCQQILDWYLNDLHIYIAATHLAD